MKHHLTHAQSINLAWTVRKIQQTEEYIDMREIARRLKIPLTTVHRHCRRHGISLRRWNHWKARIGRQRHYDFLPIHSTAIRAAKMKIGDNVTITASDGMLVIRKILNASHVAM